VLRRTLHTGDLRLARIRRDEFLAEARHIFQELMPEEGPVWSPVDLARELRESRGPPRRTDRRRGRGRFPGRPLVAPHRRRGASR
jgi:hypothetical protein